MAKNHDKTINKGYDAQGFNADGVDREGYDKYGHTAVYNNIVEINKDNSCKQTDNNKKELTIQIQDKPRFNAV